MLVKIKTIKKEDIVVNLNNVTTLRVVPVDRGKYAISMVILPGKEILIDLLGEGVYNSKTEADEKLDDFLVVLNNLLKPEGNGNGTNNEELKEALCWFGTCEGEDLNEALDWENEINN